MYAYILTTNILFAHRSTRHIEEDEGNLDLVEQDNVNDKAEATQAS